MTRLLRDDRFTSLRQAVAGTFRFGIDLDGCVAEYHGALRTYAQQRLGRPLPDMTAYDGWDEWGISREEFFALHNDAVDVGLFRTLTPIPGALDALWALSDAGIANVVVTARLTRGGRHKTVLTDTAHWLDEVVDPDASDGRHGIPYIEPHFTPFKQSVLCDLWVDDSPGNITAIRAAHGPDAAVVFDQPWNRHLDGLRVHGWAELADLVLERSAQRRFDGGTNGTTRTIA